MRAPTKALVMLLVQQGARRDARCGANEAAVMTDRCAAGAACESSPAPTPRLCACRVRHSRPRCSTKTHRQHRTHPHAGAARKRALSMGEHDTEHNRSNRDLRGQRPMSGSFATTRDTDDGRCRAQATLIPDRRRRSQPDAAGGSLIPRERQRTWYQLRSTPVGGADSVAGLLGRGQQLFTDSTTVPKPRLVKTQPFRSGIGLLRYL